MPAALEAAVPGRPAAALDAREPSGAGVLHIADVLDDADVPPGIRLSRERLGVGSYSQVFAPMLWEGAAIGALYVIAPAAGRLHRPGDRPAARPSPTRR